jgi:hypothetical protein
MKPWWKSRMIWLNGAAGAVAFIAGAWDDVGKHIPVWLTYSAGMIVAGANVALRFVTTDAIVAKVINKEDGQ